MSINVTVTGNPVNIKRGQMITNPQTEKNEFDKRRLLRLEQVRQQSKDLAENVRNKVRNEKKKQLKDIERDGKEKLKNWQNRKLLELQNQYLDALDEIGVGHKEAEQLADESDILESQRIINEEAAKARGKLAETKQQVEINENSYKKAVPIQHKKLVRDIENTRAALVSGMRKKCPKANIKQTHAKAKKKSTSADINITIPNGSDFSETSSSDSSSKHVKNCERTIREDSSRDSENVCESSGSSQDHTRSVDSKSKVRGRKSCSKENIAPKLKSYQETLEERRQLIEDFRAHPKQTPLDTRISDRIRQRQLLTTQPDYCDSPVAESQIQRSSRPIKDPLELSSDDCTCSKLHRCCPCKTSRSAAVQTEGQMICKCDFAKSSSCKTDLRFGAESAQINTSHAISPRKDIPSKPPIKLKATQEVRNVASTASTAHDRVPHYDFPNRFTADKQSATQVEKIDGGSLEVVPNLTSEAEWHEKLKQRDIDAQVRGKRAMEKEKAQRDYQELIKKLPMLQRKEHIAQIGTDKPEYHMSEERLKERERERQNRLENAYSQAIPALKPQVVTLPKRKMEIQKTNEPFEILNGDDSRTLNLGKWDTGTGPKTMFSAEEVQEIIRAFTVQKPEDRKAKLKQLLKSLKLQKEQLINEIRSLPRDDSIDALIVDLTSFSDDDKPNRSAKSKPNDKARKRRLEESDTSDTSSDAAVRHRRSKSKGHHKEKYGRSPNKKMKKPASRVLVLQNISTQTSPKATKEKASTTTSTTGPSEEKIELLPNSVKICTKSHVPCDCYKGKDGGSSEEVCKIFIKIDEEKSPKIEVVRSSGDHSDELLLKEDKKISSPRKSTDNLRSSKENKSPRNRQRRVVIKSVAPEINIPALNDSKKPLEGKKETWKEQFSKNSMSTSSTSYMSPPDFSRLNTTASTETSKQSMYNLRRKPQQKEMAFGLSGAKVSSQSSYDQDQRIKAQLLNYIQRLLSMSKASVDDLGISSSDVQTPSQSIIEMEPNNPLAALHNAIRLINFRTDDFVKDLSDFIDGRSVPPNSANASSDCSASRQQPVPSEKGNSGSSGKQTKEFLLSQYADVTDSCTKRISNLATMIEQLRQEKLQMMESPPLMPLQDTALSPQANDVSRLTPTFNDKDNSTKYFEFPPYGDKQSSNSTCSLDEEELNRRLLEIDMSLAEKLKKFRRDKDGAVENTKLSIDHLEPQPALLVSEGPIDHSDQQFLDRLHRLIQESHERDQTDKPPSAAANEPQSFIPFLVDIPKLPILELEPDKPSGGPEKRHPPPSKGLITVKKFNGDISLMPHELSTIVEADSQLSARISSPNQSKSNTTIDRELQQLLVHSLSPPAAAPPLPVNKPKSFEKSDAISEDRSQRRKSTSENKVDFSDANKSLTCSDSTCTNLVLSSSSSKLSSSSSTSDLKSIEAMLKSIGMEWAIPTLHKTQEALALTSSSSSVDLSSKKRRTRKSTTDSEVSLKEFLKKQLLGKVSSSSLNKSDASPASFVRECSEVSAIHDKTKQRTSTPVLSSKSTSKSKDEQLFSGVSDISSVRNSSANGSGKQTFHSLAGDNEQSSATRSSVE